jgi:hypothetical protein
LGTGPALEAHFQFLQWLIPAVEKFPRAQNFLLGDRIQTTGLDVLEQLIDATYTRDRRGHLAREKAPLLSGGNFSREVVRSKASHGGKESILFLIVSGIAYHL